MKSITRYDLTLEISSAKFKNEIWGNPQKERKIKMTNKEIMVEYLLENEWENVGVIWIGESLHLTLRQENWSAPIVTMAKGLAQFLAGDYEVVDVNKMISPIDGKAVSITLEVVSN